MIALLGHGRQMPVAISFSGSHRASAFASSWQPHPMCREFILFSSELLLLRGTSIYPQFMHVQ